MKKFTIAIDFDGVLANIHKPYLKHRNILYGTNYKSSDITHWDHVAFTEDKNEFLRMINTEAFMNCVLPYKNAIDILCLLHKEKMKGFLDYYILTVRGRSNGEQEKIRRIIQKWIYNKGHGTIKPVRVEFAKNFEDKFNFDWDVLLEDCPDIINQGQDKKRRIIAMNQPWNIKVPDKPYQRKAGGWIHAYGLITVYYTAWRLGKEWK